MYAFHVDSADVTETAALLRTGLVAGVTTNPTVLKRAGQGRSDLARLHDSWAALGAREVFFQATGPTTADLLASGRSLRALGSDVVVKVPATPAGLAAARALGAEGVPLLVTAVYTPVQAMAAETIGAEYIAPYLGRMNDAGRDGVAEIARMVRLLAGSGTEVLAASLRRPDDLVELAERGVRSFTAAPAVLHAAFDDETTARAAEVFEADALP